MRRLLNLGSLWSRKAPVGQTPADVVHCENKWRLLRYRPRADGVAFQTPVLLVPSLINRHYVLDLMPGKSLAEYLVTQGHDTWIIDWGTPGDEDRHLGFDDFADRYLGRALRIASEHGAHGQSHVLGYCMGGTLGAIHAALRPERVASLTALAAPIRFSDAGVLSTWMRSPAFDPAAVVDAFGNIPWPLMQLAFHLLRPTQSISKLISLFDKADNDEFVDGFVAVETWGNDNVAFPGRCFREYVEELYRKDALIHGTFSVGGRRVDLGAIRCPTLAVTFETDHIVPPASAAVLLEKIGATDKERIHLPGGHVGSVVSRSAAKHLWPRLSEFWAKRDAAPVDVGVAESASQPAATAKADAVDDPATGARSTSGSARAAGGRSVRRRPAAPPH